MFINQCKCEKEKVINDYFGYGKEASAMNL